MNSEAQSKNRFVWGVATASYQIEGAAELDGRGPGNWDVFATRPGATYQAHNASVACNHYELLEQDLDLLSELGVSAYRFGFSWPRILPGGVGAINEAGIRFYDRLVDGLLSRGITPYATLFHWDLPWALEQRGGFRNTDAPLWFEEMTSVLARRFSDRIKFWFTLNEPHAFIEGGLRHGRHAPGHRLPLSEVLLAGHNALLAHGRATRVLRAEIPGCWVAMAPVLISATPLTESAEDIQAARDFTFAMVGPELRVSSWWMDPAFGLGYPEDGLRHFHGSLPKITTTDMDTIAQPLDAVGFNLYDAQVVRAGADGKPQVVPPAPGTPRTAFNWLVSPEAHYWGLRFAAERYKKPVMVTENGLSCRDWVHLDGTVPDSERVDFLQRHLLCLGRARREGIPVAGYFHWSLLDNFEWNHGYRERFGLVHVDYQTQKRTPKASFYAYKRAIEGDGHIA